LDVESLAAALFALPSAFLFPRMLMCPAIYLSVSENLCLLW
jgi:hypothetical protein